VENDGLDRTSLFLLLAHVITSCSQIRFSLTFPGRLWLGSVSKPFHRIGVRNKRHKAMSNAPTERRRAHRNGHEGWALGIRR
ncbi:hypothetical protein, partial [Pseudomonas syringae]|uniref:hypothetical protein n=1 Tax=Pseudomonas syringae TaxID=317 RepID=UPI001F07A0A7